MAAAAATALVASQREAARRLGVSHTALQKAAQAGRIAPEPGGGWDIDKLRARLAASSDLARQPTAMVTPTPLAAPAPTPEPLPAAGGTSFHHARTANEMLKARERRLRLDERRGQLVDKRRALLLVHRLAKEERDAVLAWPARVAAGLEITTRAGVRTKLVDDGLAFALRCGGAGEGSRWPLPDDA